MLCASTLFNRFLGEQAAIVEDHPGVTRDRNTREVEWCGRHFDAVDTGGWMPGGSVLDSKVSRQVETAAREADLVLFLVDATVGLNDDDEAIAAWLRTTSRPILLIANKVDSPTAESDLWQFLSLGLGDALPVSAFPPDGTWPVGTTQWEKRNIAENIPIWQPDLCTQCNHCVAACPHSAIRAKVVQPEAMSGAPENTLSISLQPSSRVSPSR